MDVYVTKGIDASFVSAVMDAALTVFAFIALVEAKKWIKGQKKMDIK
jgi:hypothetical protein